MAHEVEININGDIDTFEMDVPKSKIPQIVFEGFHEFEWRDLAKESDKLGRCDIAIKVDGEQVYSHGIECDQYIAAKFFIALHTADYGPEQRYVGPEVPGSDEFWEEVFHEGYPEMLKEEFQ